MIETVIFITAKFRVLPEHADQWADIAREFTEATRQPGNLWFRLVAQPEDPAEYLLVEAFLDGDAGRRTCSPTLQGGHGCAPRLPS